MTKDPRQHYIDGITLRARHSASNHAYELALANYDTACQTGDTKGMEEFRLEAISLLEAHLDLVAEMWVWNRNTPV